MGQNEQKTSIANVQTDNDDDIYHVRLKTGHSYGQEGPKLDEM